MATRINIVAGATLDIRLLMAGIFAAFKSKSVKMKTFMIFLFALLIISCNSQDRQVLGILKNGAPAPTPLIIIGGESNAGGKVPNSSATSAELAPRSNVKIINSYTLLFETLDIGTNSTLDHQDIPDNANLHGWELQIANRQDSGTFLPASPLYLVKTGQGSSKIDWWDEGTTYYTKFKNRVDAAFSILQGQGKTVQPYLFWTQGLNDVVQGTSVATWKQKTKDHFAKMRVRYGFMPIFMTKFNDIAGTSAFNTAIDEICSEVSDCYAISTAGAAVNNPTSDPYHWNYAGMKLIASRLIDKLLTTYPQ